MKNNNNLNISLQKPNLFLNILKPQKYLIIINL